MKISFEIMQENQRRRRADARKDNHATDYDYVWEVGDDGDFDYDSDYEYKDYYENNIEGKLHKNGENSDFSYLIHPQSEKPFNKFYSEVKNGKRKKDLGVKENQRRLLTTLAPLTMNFDFNDERKEIFQAQEEMFDRIMEYSSSI